MSVTFRSNVHSFPLNCDLLFIFPHQSWTRSKHVQPGSKTHLNMKITSTGCQIKEVTSWTAKCWMHDKHTNKEGEDIFCQLKVFHLHLHRCLPICGLVEAWCQFQFHFKLGLRHMLGASPHWDTLYSWPWFSNIRHDSVRVSVTVWAVSCMICAGC